MSGSIPCEYPDEPHIVKNKIPCEDGVICYLVVRFDTISACDWTGRGRIEDSAQHCGCRHSLNTLGQMMHFSTGSERCLLSLSE